MKYPYCNDQLFALLQNNKVHALFTMIIDRFVCGKTTTRITNKSYRQQ